MGLFSKKKKKNKLGDKILEFIQENLPRSLYAFMGINDEEDEIIISYKHSAYNFQFNTKNKEYESLTDADKAHIQKMVIIPIIKKFDDELKNMHIELQKKLEELSSNNK